MLLIVITSFTLMAMEVATTNIALVASNKIICMIYAMPQQLDGDQTNVFWKHFLLSIFGTRLGSLCNQS